MGKYKCVATSGKLKAETETRVIQSPIFSKYSRNAYKNFLFGKRSQAQVLRCLVNGHKPRGTTLFS